MFKIVETVTHRWCNPRSR